MVNDIQEVIDRRDLYRSKREAIIDCVQQISTRYFNSWTKGNTIFFKKAGISIFLDFLAVHDLFNWFFWSNSHDSLENIGLFIISLLKQHEIKFQLNFK